MRGEKEEVREGREGLRIAAREMMSVVMDSKGGRKNCVQLKRSVDGGELCPAFCVAVDCVEVLDEEFDAALFAQRGGSGRRGGGGYRLGFGWGRRR